MGNGQGRFAVFCPASFTCPYCEKAKKMLRSNGFTEANRKMVVTKTDDLENLTLPDETILHPRGDSKMSYPQIYYQPTTNTKFQYVGGLDKLEKVFRG